MNFVWQEKSKEILRQACLVGRSWPEILTILFKSGIKVSQSSAYAIADKEKYPRPCIKKGGARDHSHDEKQLFKRRPSTICKRV